MVNEDLIVVNTKCNTSGVKYNSGRIWKTFMHLFFILFSLSCILPVLIVLSTSFSNETDVVRDGYGLLPKGFTILAYQTIFYNPLMLVRAYGVTILVSATGVVCGLWLVSSLAYVLSRNNFLWKKQLSFYVFFTMIFNGGVVPFYILITIWMGLKDNILALILPYLVSAWYVLILKGFMKSIPNSLIESAKIDGAGEVRIFVGIILPVSKPAIATVGLFLLLQYWNDWWLSMLFINHEELFSLQYLLVRILQNIEFLSQNLSKLVSSMSTMKNPALTARFAMCVLAAGPMLFIFMFFQKYFARGIIVGSIKE